MVDDPSDEAADFTDAADAHLTAGLRTTTPEVRARLRAALRAVQRTRKPLVEWRGGQRGADGAFQMPFPVYHPAVDRLVEVLEEAHTVAAGFDWMHWDGARRYRLASDVLNAPVADAVRLITAIVRGERFCDGNIAAAIEDGRLLAAAQRVLDGSRAESEITREDDQRPGSRERPTKHFIALPPEPTPEEVREIAGQLFDALQEDVARHARSKGVDGD